MAELTTETMRQILKEELQNTEGRIMQNVNDRINQVLETMQELHEEHTDELRGTSHRLSDHDRRIARLERLNKLSA